jgi:hypothetical protein
VTTTHMDDADNAVDAVDAVDAGVVSAVEVESVEVEAVGVEAVEVEAANAVNAVGVEEDAAPQDQHVTMSHYIRTWTIPRDKIEEILVQWEHMYPIGKSILVSFVSRAVHLTDPDHNTDFQRIAVIRHRSLSDNGPVTLSYLGACIAATPIGRLLSDEKGAGFSMLKRFTRVLRGESHSRRLDASHS